LLTGPLKFTPVERAEGKRYYIEGQVALDAVYLTEGVPSGIRTRVTALKGLGPGPG
jgi:site-specific DNA recombinase